LPRRRWHATKPPLRRRWRQGLRGGSRPVASGRTCGGFAEARRRISAQGSRCRRLGCDGRVGLRCSWLDDVEEGLGDDGVAGVFG